MGSDLFELTLEGARDPITQKLNQALVLPRTLIVPKNSNIQIVYADVMHSIERAKRFKPPFREYAIQMAYADLQGMISISSEMGAFIREFNTVRSSVPIGQVQGQPATWFDDYVYGKDKMKNNPHTKDLGIGNF
ncbi:MAG: hypothetical protein GTO44_10010 [Hydrotalea flava]|nr:hypothetical protein [Hydrotalea flava]NIN15387.1 hypothetical protein [Hydrotalea flava]